MPKFEFQLSKRPAPAPVASKPRRPPGRPPAKPKSPPSSNNTLLVNNILDSVEDEESAKNLKSQMTVKELKFLEFHLVEGMNIDKSMISAGYGNLSQDGRYYIAKKIKEKYGTQAGDHRKIFRMVGAGEVAVAQGLLSIAQGPYPADVRRKAWADIASCLGLKSEQVEGLQGMSINIRGMAPEDKGLVVEVDGQAAKPALPPPFKPAQVTK